MECKHCGELIGVYEPMFVVTEAQARETSPAAEQGLGEMLGDCYHDGCYWEVHGEDAAPE